MKPADLIREFLYPLTEAAILSTALLFWLIFSVAKFAVTVLYPIGIIGAVILVSWATPAYFRYLLYLLEARAEGKDAPTFDAELFALADKLWSLSPLLLVALLIWGWVAIADLGIVWSGVYGFSILAILPASVAVLAITHSPLESVNPIAIFRMIRVCGVHYVLIPVTVVAIFLSQRWLVASNAPNIVIEWIAFYQSLFMVTFTGALLRAKDVTMEVEIDAPIEKSAEVLAEDLDKARQNVITHAYGFISRGNREGGFAHILDWIGKEPDVDAASAWFFRKMMKWESQEPALYFAQTYLAHLLHHDEDAQSLKLISACLHVDPAWKPRSEDRALAIELAERYQRDDILGMLRN